MRATSNGARKAPDSTPPRGSLVHNLWMLTPYLLAAALSLDGLQTVDEQKLVAQAPLEFGLFGFEVELEDDTLVVAGIGFSVGVTVAGEVQIFERTPTGWAPTERLVTPDGADLDEFGTGLALDGDRLFVGARSHDLTNEDAGAVYVYERGGGGPFTFVQKLVASGPDLGDLFGWSIAADGDRVAIGAPSDDEDGNNSGAVYLFERVGGTWIQTLKFNASNTIFGDQFGSSVDLQGDILMVSSPLTDINEGTVYVFQRVGVTWVEQQLLNPSDAQTNQNFGARVDLDGDSVLIGAFQDDNSGGPFTGAAYVFTSSGGTWTEQQKLTGSDTASGAFFGTRVALDGDRAIVGAWAHTTDELQAGSAYVFDRFGAQWTETAALTPSDAAETDLFGLDVDLQGGEVVVGAVQADIGATSNAGAAYVFTLRTPRPSFCSADTTGCTLCPCNNDAPPGTCGGCLNANGTSARLLSFGDASLAADELRFELENATPSTFALLVSADNQLPQMGPCPPGSGIAPPELQGLRCVGGNLVRHGTRAIAADGSAGMTTPGWGAPDGPAQGLLLQGSFTAGQVRHFQIFYRDEQRGCGLEDVNTTDAVTVIVGL